MQFLTHFVRQVIDNFVSCNSYVKSLYLPYSGLCWTSMKGHAMEMVMLVHAGSHTRAKAALGAGVWCVCVGGGVQPDKFFIQTGKGLSSLAPPPRHHHTDEGDIKGFHNWLYALLFKALQGKKMCVLQFSGVFFERLKFILVFLPEVVWTAVMCNVTKMLHSSPVTSAS